jgi:hypothetical protein
MAVKRPAPRQAILLSGMYRSGTSAASRALSFLGFAQPQLLVEAGPANPKGFWEASRIVQANEAMLQALGWSWDKTPLLTEPGFSPDETQADLLAHLRTHWLAPAREAIAASYRSDAHNVICKDPLLSLFPAFWQAAFEAEGFEVHHVLTFRHPLETAASLKRHKELGRAGAFRAWLHYNLRPLTQVEVAATLDYNDLIAQPVETVNAIARRLGVSELDKAAAAELRAFLDPADNHGQSEAEGDEARLPKLITDTMEILRDWRVAPDDQLRRRAHRMRRIAQDAELIFGRPQRLPVTLSDAPLAEAPAPAGGRAGGRGQKRSLVLHYHLFKNAGTSVDEVLRSNFGAGWANAEFHVRRRQPNVHQVEEWIAAHSDVCCLSSHTALFPLPRLDGLSVTPVIFVRHPLDRIHSAYEFERRQSADTPGARLARQAGFADYVRARLAKQDGQVRNFHVVRLAPYPTGGGTSLERALRAVDDLPFVGLVEDFAQSMTRMEAVLAGSFPQFRAFGAKANAWRGGATLEDRLAQIREELGAELHAELVAANAEDMVLFEKVAGLYGLGDALARAS